MTTSPYEIIVMAHLFEIICNYAILYYLNFKNDLDCSDFHAFLAKSLQIMLFLQNHYLSLLCANAVVRYLKLFCWLFSLFYSVELEFFVITYPVGRDDL